MKVENVVDVGGDLFAFHGHYFAATSGTESFRDLHR